MSAGTGTGVIGAGRVGRGVPGPGSSGLGMGVGRAGTVGCGPVVGGRACGGATGVGSGRAGAGAGTGFEGEDAVSAGADAVSAGAGMGVGCAGAGAGTGCDGAGRAGGRGRGSWRGGAGRGRAGAVAGGGRRGAIATVVGVTWGLLGSPAMWPNRRLRPTVTTKCWTGPNAVPVLRVRGDFRPTMSSISKRSATGPEPRSAPRPAATDVRVSGFGPYSCPSTKAVSRSSSYRTAPSPNTAYGWKNRLAYGRRSRTIRSTSPVISRKFVRESSNRGGLDRPPFSRRPTRPAHPSACSMPNQPGDRRTLPPDPAARLLYAALPVSAVTAPR